jgi:septal ring factor EnvC (AmiA/AmiB activator)
LAVVRADHPIELLLHEHRPPVVESPRPRRRLTRRGRWVAAVASGCVLAIAIGLLVADQVHQRNQFDTSRSALTVTRQHIATESAQLADLRHDLATLETQVGSDTTAFDQVSSQLKGAQTALDSAQAHVTQQASQITSLHTCLAGVEEALNALAVNSRPRAFAALESVSSSCTSAAASSG